MKKMSRTVQKSKFSRLKSKNFSLVAPVSSFVSALKQLIFKLAQPAQLLFHDEENGYEQNVHEENRYEQHVYEEIGYEEIGYEERRQQVSRMALGGGRM